jgi:hypothetical protein
MRISNGFEHNVSGGKSVVAGYTLTEKRTGEPRSLWQERVPRRRTGDRQRRQR